MTLKKNETFKNKYINKSYFKTLVVIVSVFFLVVIVKTDAKAETSSVIKNSARSSNPEKKSSQSAKSSINSQGKSNKESQAKSLQSKKINPLQKPKLKEGEYSVYFNDRYHTLTFKKVGLLEVMSSCRIDKPLNCAALKINKKNISPYSQKPRQITNPGAASCLLLEGQNLLGYDHLDQMHDICRFKDGSYTMSWSLFGAFYADSYAK